MDDYRISKRIIWILILSVTIFSSNMIISNNYNGISTKYQELTFSINSIDTPIAIFSDIDFYFYSFLGDGSKETPYIIENKNIISTNGQNAIEIKNTTKYFIIRNCYLETDAEGIRIENIANGTAIITKNTFKGNPSDAIVVTNCSFINVENNTGSNNHVGIRISYSSNITILNNSFYGGVLTEFLTASGIGITNSYDIVVRNNTLNFFNRGIYAKECGNLTIRNNLIYNTREYGSIYLHLSNNNLIENNTVYNNIYSDGLRILTSSYNEICYNTIYCCSEYGIKLTTGSNYNIVHHNNILYNYFDGEFQGFDNSIGNIWFNVTSEEGNFWSDWNGVGNYLLDGGIYNYDNYPNENPISINLEELYIPDTSNDDIYEENDFVRSSYAFPM
ncbi:MAG: nitrous oxide reductase family maturation protein NosD, partial [Candidatus Thorarchaeota archaeon]